MNIKTDKSFKHDYEKLDPASEKFKFLKETFMTTFFRFMLHKKKQKVFIYTR